MPKTSVPQVDKELGGSSRVAVAPGKRAPVKAPSHLDDLNAQLSGATSAVRKASNESMSFDCHHNHETGGPHMPWMKKSKKSKKSKMESLLGKYSTLNEGKQSPKKRR